MRCQRRGTGQCKKTQKQRTLGQTHEACEEGLPAESNKFMPRVWTAHSYNPQPPRVMGVGQLLCGSKPFQSHLTHLENGVVGM